MIVLEDLEGTKVTIKANNDNDALLIAYNFVVYISFALIFCMIVLHSLLLARQVVLLLFSLFYCFCSVVNDDSNTKAKDRNIEIIMTNNDT